MNKEKLMTLSTNSIVVRPVKKDERDKVRICIAWSFHKGSLVNGLPEIPGFIQFEPEEDSFFWAVFVDNEPVSALMLIPFEISVGITSFHVIGLTGVGTHPDHQHKGYASMLLKAVHKFAR